MTPRPTWALAPDQPLAHYYQHGLPLCGLHRAVPSGSLSPLPHRLFCPRCARCRRYL